MSSIKIDFTVFHEEQLISLASCVYLLFADGIIFLSAAGGPRTVSFGGMVERAHSYRRIAELGDCLLCSM